MERKQQKARRSVTKETMVISFDPDDHKKILDLSRALGYTPARLVEYFVLKGIEGINPARERKSLNVRMSLKVQQMLNE